MLLLTHLASADTLSYIVTFGDGSEIPFTALDQVKELVKELGGRITHEYSLIKGFSLEVPSSASSEIITQLDHLKEKLGCGIQIEKDSEVHAFGGHDF